MLSRILSKVIRIGGGKLLDRAVGRLVPAKAEAASGLGKGLTGIALTRIATRSVPGAIIVGGGMLAKMLYDRRHAPRDAVAPAEDGEQQ